MYHARLGRFISRDPIGYANGMGLYEYVRGNPSALSDPSGHRVNCKRVTDLKGFETSMKTAGGSSFIYTCGCGWIDKTHLVSAEAKKMTEKLMEARTKGTAFSYTASQESVTGLVESKFSITAGQVGQLTTAAKIKTAVLQALVVQAFFHEAGQAMSPAGKAASVADAVGLIDSGKSGYSGEDMPSNYIGILWGIYEAQLPTRDRIRILVDLLLETLCGPVLSKKDAKALCDAGCIPGTTSAFDAHGRVKAVTYTNKHTKACVRSGKPVAPAILATDMPMEKLTKKHRAGYLMKYGQVYAPGSSLLGWKGVTTGKSILNAAEKARFFD